jgi:site-specific DNA-adenine methylase
MATTVKAKPFIKWVGGKSQLIEQLEALLPADFDNWENVTYIEPFVGGGAIVFSFFSVKRLNKKFLRMFATEKRQL